MHRNLSDILSDIENMTEIANRDLSDISPRLQAGHQMAVREAKEAVVALTVEYSKALLSNTAGFFTAGDPVKCAAFAQLAASECGTLTVSVDELYEEIAREIELTQGDRREFGVTQLVILSRALRDIGNRLKLTGTLVVPRLPEVLVVDTAAELATLVKRLVTEANGHALMVEFSQRAIIERGLATKYAGKTTRVVILNVSEPEAIALKDTFRSRKIVSIEADTVVDASFAIATVDGQKAADKAAKAAGRSTTSKPSEAPTATTPTDETTKENE